MKKKIALLIFMALIVTVAQAECPTEQTATETFITQPEPFGTRN